MKKRAFFLLGLGIAITQMTIGEPVDIVSDIGLGTTELFLTGVTIFMGISIIQKELSLRTLHPLLARPLTRSQYILGKFFGMTLLALVGLLFMALVLWGMLVVYGGGDRMAGYIPALYTAFLQTLVVIAVAVLCSSFVEPAIGALVTVSFYLIGATSYSLAFLVTKYTGETLQKAVTALRYVLPDFSHFNIKDNLVYGRGLEGIDLAYASLYALAWIVIVLAGATLLFNRKEIN